MWSGLDEQPGSRTAINKCGLEFRRAKVGDRHILQILEENDWYLGGETSGHILSLDMHTTGDGIVSALKVLQAVITIGDKLADFIADLQLMPQLLINVPLIPGKNWPINEEFKNAQRRVIDELGSGGRILVRASGTEPVIRVMAEQKMRNSRSHVSINCCLACSNLYSLRKTFISGQLNPDQYCYFPLFLLRRGIYIWVVSIANFFTFS